MLRKSSSILFLKKKNLAHEKMTVYEEIDKHRRPIIHGL